MLFVAAALCWIPEMIAQRMDTETADYANYILGVFCLVLDAVMILVWSFYGLFLSTWCTSFCTTLHLFELLLDEQKWRVFALKLRCRSSKAVKAPEYLGEVRS
jgi:hypothetical protein